MKLRLRTHASIAQICGASGAKTDIDWWPWGGSSLAVATGIFPNQIRTKIIIFQGPFKPEVR
jgi:hypothetical protein